MADQLDYLGRLQHLTRPPTLEEMILMRQGPNAPGPLNPLGDTVQRFPIPSPVTPLRKPDFQRDVINRYPIPGSSGTSLPPGIVPPLPYPPPLGPEAATRIPPASLGPEAATRVPPGAPPPAPTAPAPQVSAPSAPAAPAGPLPPPSPPESPEKAQERVGKWDNLLATLTGPGMEGALLNFGLALMQPFDPKQTAVGHVASSAQGALASVAARRAAQQAAGVKERETAATERKAAAAEKQAEASAANVERLRREGEATGKREERKIDLESAATASLSKLQAAQARLADARAKNVPVDEAGEERHWRLQAADAIEKSILAKNPEANAEDARIIANRLALGQPGLNPEEARLQAKTDIQTGNYALFVSPEDKQLAIDLVDQVYDTYPGTAAAPVIGRPASTQAPAEGTALPMYKGRQVTERDIAVTMRATGMSREEVLRRLRSGQ